MRQILPIVVAALLLAACVDIEEHKLYMERVNDQWLISDFDGHKIKEGEIMALTGGKIAFVDSDVQRATLKLAGKMIRKNSEFVTVIYGKDMTDVAAGESEAKLNEKYGDKVEITLVNGGQPVYYYIISVE